MQFLHFEMLGPHLEMETGYVNKAGSPYNENILNPILELDYLLMKN